MDNKPIMVSICCLTYNHAPYIRECLDGFLKQQVNFPMEIIVHDDASTDGTQDILREYKEKYPDLFHLILQTENQYSKGRNIIVDYLFREIKGEYFAFCEGDDYWTDSHKLQKQVDFLETHSDYSLCCHLTPVYLQKERLIVNRESPKQIDGDSDVSFSLVDWVNWGYFFQTSSVVGRVSSLDMLFLSSFKVCKDLHLFYSLLEFKKGYFIKTPMSVYRVHDVGAWSGLSFENQKLVALTDIYDIYKQRKNKYTRKWLLANMSELILFYIRKEKNWAEALKVFPMIVDYCGYRGLGYVFRYISKKLMNRYILK